jgi:hypothetical protein
MNWAINFLIRVLGAFLTSFGILGVYQMVRYPDTSPAWVVVSLTIGLALLFAPEIKKK